jgi:hypothetical protein
MGGAYGWSVSCALLSAVKVNNATMAQKDQGSFRVCAACVPPSRCSRLSRCEVDVPTHQPNREWGNSVLLERARVPEGPNVYSYRSPSDRAPAERDVPGRNHIQLRWSRN